MKRNSKSCMALLLAACMTIGTFASAGSLTLSAEAAASREITGTEAAVTQSGNQYTIGNQYLTRTFSTDASVLKTVDIQNYRTDGEKTTKFVPAEGSTEFVIATMKDVSAEDAKALDQTGWEAKADSEHGSESDGNAAKAIDNNTTTIWHSGYDKNSEKHNNGSSSKIPYHFVLDMGIETSFRSIGYTGRSNGSNGRFNNVEIYLYNGDKDDLNFDSSEWGDPVKTVSLKDTANRQYINFESMQTAKMLLFKVNTSYGSSKNTWATAAEIDLYDEEMGTGLVENGFTSDDLKVKEVSYKDVEATVNKQEKTGVELTVEFETYTYEQVAYSIKEIVTMYDGDSFMRKHLEISVPESQAASAKIEYIDLENMQIAETYLAPDTYWTIPEQADNSDMANMKGDYLELGQPYYLSAMYWGCEFPQTENKIRNGQAFIRYHYGKSLAKDTHFEYNKNNTAGQMTTWDAVVGAARSTDYSVVQADFYEYIETIATDTDFRQQYNSWYDNMKNITKENLERSFFEIEKGFTQNGVNPLDSYVADDGWINYNSFWDFDTSKFPNELYDASLQASQMGSHFGLWLGPRGGYGTDTTISAWIANHNLGSRNPQSGYDINISDARYLNKLRDDIFIGYQNKFDINYWKLDGMLLEPCTVESEYYTTSSAFATITETYERWTDLYENMRDSYEKGHTEDDPVLWLNMTSYTNPSPWHVQWVNSVWMQNTGDTGYNNSFNATDEQAMLTYRDNSYYNFLKERQWQLPNKYFYNHDPVYGLTANDAYNRPDIEYTTEELRDHLYMLGTRGTAFWEYYYSYSMFDEEKWDVNAEAANWIEDNFDILQKSQMIGGKPGNGDVYGYSCWNGSEGIVSLRNPKNEEQTYTLTFDRLIGVAEGTKNVYGKVIVGDLSYQDDTPISYGSTIQVTLPAKEVLIVQYGAKDTTAAKIESVHATDASTVEVEFNETLRTPETSNFTVEGNTVTKVSLKADLRTAVLTLGTALEKNAEFTVQASGVKDTVGNTALVSGTGKYYENNLVASVGETSFDGTNQATIASETSICGKEGFTVLGNVTTSSKNVTLIKQENAYEVSIDQDGYLVFTLANGLSVQSKYTAKTVNRSTGNVTAEERGLIADGTEHSFTAVKEINGMIKLYIDGKLVASSYDEDKINPTLSKGAVTIGAGMTGTMKYAAIADTALAYDEVEEYAKNLTGSAETPNVNIEKIPSDQMTGTASSVDETEANFDKSATKAYDGDANTFWATAPEAGKTLADASFILELDEITKICRVDYTKRYDSGAGWNCTGNLLNYVIEVSTDGETWTQVATGETVDGTTEITFAKVEAKYVKLTATKSYHWKEELVNTVMTVAELVVYKDTTPAAVDKTELMTAVEEAEEINNDNCKYTAESFKALTDAISEAQAVLEKTDATEADVTNALAALQAAKAALKEATTDLDPTPDPDPTPNPAPTPNPDPTPEPEKPTETHPAPSTSTNNSGTTTTAMNATGTGASTGDQAQITMMLFLCAAAAVCSVIVKNKRRSC